MVLNILSLSQPAMFSGQGYRHPNRDSKRNALTVNLSGTTKICRNTDIFKSRPGLGREAIKRDALERLLGAFNGLKSDISRANFLVGGIGRD
jgi:hypothetical protein